jgi:hypothetical protein
MMIPMDRRYGWEYDGRRMEFAGAYNRQEAPSAESFCDRTWTSGQFNQLDN